MNLKLIALAAMLAATGAAQAKVADSNDRNPSGPNNTLSGDMFANVWSVSTNASFTVDLGIALHQWTAASMNVAGIKLVWDLDDGTGTFTDMSAVSTGLTTQPLNYGSIWTSFATTSVLGAADLKFDVKAMDGTPGGLPAVGANRYLSTSLASDLTVTNGQVFAMDNWDGILNASNADTTNTTHGTDIEIAGANKFDASLGDAMNVNYNAGGEQWNGAVSFSSAGSVNSPLNFFLLTNTSSTAANPATDSKYAGTWTFNKDTAQLTYMTAPVPEPETYAMMLAGLGLVGFMVSRRRKLA